jgi:hypothetical protein
MATDRAVRGLAVVVFGIALMIFGAMAASGTWVGLVGFIGLIVALVGLLIAVTDSPSAT